MATAGPAGDDLAETPDDAAFDRTTTGDVLIGQMLGEYRVLSRLGSGAMGVVYRGEQPVIRKPVAIKVLHPSLGSDKGHVERLLEEARAISAARHPNIIDIFSFGEAPTGQQYFVMECLEGEPLDVWLAQHGRPTIHEAADLLKQIFAGLTAAHAAGVIHRDLKPGNIFLARMPDGSNFVKLLDFGLAKRAAPNAGVRPTANVIVGTPLYMAPEQVTAQEVGPWTDLYAVGCIAYELITGVPLFAGAGSLIETLHMHTHGVPPPPTSIDPSIPRSFEALVLELLAKAPAQRPKSAAVARRALERIDRQLSVAPTRGTGHQIPAEAARTQVAIAAIPQRRWLHIAVPVALVLAGIAAAVLLWPSPAPVVVMIEAPRPPPIPAAEEPDPEPEPEAPRPVAATRPPPPEPKPGPRVRAARPKSALDLRNRIARLRARAAANLNESAERIAHKQLDEIATEAKTGARRVEDSWTDLDIFEAATFGSP